jgi:hypothetical protein
LTQFGPKDKSPCAQPSFSRFPAEVEQQLPEFCFFAPSGARCRPKDPVLVGSWSKTRRQQPKKSSKFVLAHRVPSHGVSQTPEFAWVISESARLGSCFKSEVFHDEYRSKPSRECFKKIDSPGVKTGLGPMLKKLYVAEVFRRSRTRRRPRPRRNSAERDVASAMLSTRTKGCASSSFPPLAEWPKTLHIRRLAELRNTICSPQDPP